jgi:hypothetical protein
MRRLLAAAIVSTVAAGGFALPAQAFEPRVPESFFGVSAPGMWAHTVQNRDQQRDRELDGIKAAGLDWVRVELGWREIEPNPPVGGVHSYRWQAADRLVRAVASRGMELMAMPMATPAWAESAPAAAMGCGRRAAVARERIADYGSFVEAIGERYGRSGSFWAANPELPQIPITRFEIANEPNWNAFWCPEPDPERYASLLATAADRIHAVDPQARVFLGGLAALQNSVHEGDAQRGMAADEFIERVMVEEPGLAETLDGVGFHAYDLDPAMNLSLVGWLRRTMNGTGLERAEIALTEYGWRSGGPLWGAISEPLRARNYELVTGQVARTDCGITAAAAHTWQSDELDPTDLGHWYGIASPLTGDPYPSGIAYRDQVALFEGRGPTPAPRETIDVCRAPSPPDQDGDGTPDEADDYPVDPERHAGSGEQPPAPAESEREEPRVAVQRVDDEFFGVNLVRNSEDLRMADEFDAIASARMGMVRQGIDWSWIEPVAPGEGTYAERQRWPWLDRLVLRLARAGLVLRPSFAGRPAWAGSFAEQYAGFLARFARRYGPGGTLWAENGNLDERRFAVTDFEIWQSANVDDSSPEGVADAAGYASAFVAARRALEAVDPRTRALVSVSANGQAGRAGAFIRAMVGAAPELEGSIEGVAVVTEYARTADAVDGTLRDVREALDQTGSGSAPIVLGFGAPTSGAGSVSEEQRAEFFAEVASRAARSDCLVEGVYAHAWTTSGADPGNPWHWYGIADPGDASLSPSAEAYRDVAAAFTGRGEAPGAGAIHPCGREPADRDGDGTADPADPAPLDPDVSAPTATAPPAPDIAGGPGAPTASRHATFSLSGERAVSFLCSLDGAGFKPCGSSPGYSGLGHGEHVLRVRSVDELGLLGPAAARRWKVDLVGPDVELTGPQGPVAERDLRFEFRSAESPVLFACSWNDGVWQWCESPMDYRAPADGTQEFRVTAMDALGNLGPVESRTVEVMPAPGEVAIVAGPVDGGTTGPTPEFRFAAELAAGYECRLDGSGWAPCSEADGHRFSDPLLEGAHSLEVRAVGESGSAGPVTALAFEVDATAPRLAIVRKRARRRATVFMVRAGDASAVAEIEYRLDDRSWRRYSGPLRVRNTRGRHVLRARAVDPHGNAVEAVRRWRIRR